MRPANGTTTLVICLPSWGGQHSTLQHTCVPFLSPTNRPHTQQIHMYIHPVCPSEYRFSFVSILINLSFEFQGVKYLSLVKPLNKVTLDIRMMCVTRSYLFANVVISNLRPPVDCSQAKHSDGLVMRAGTVVSMEPYSLGYWLGYHLPVRLRCLHWKRVDFNLQIFFGFVMARMTRAFKLKA